MYNFTKNKLRSGFLTPLRFQTCNVTKDVKTVGYLEINSQYYLFIIKLLHTGDIRNKNSQFMLYRQQFFYPVLNFKFDSYNSVILRPNIII